MKSIIRYFPPNGTAGLARSSAGERSAAATPLERGRHDEPPAVGVDAEALRAGLAALEAPGATRRAASAAFLRWWEAPDRAAYRPLLAALVAEGRFAEILDAFGAVLPFGTGGMRGAVGVGPNRINRHTVAKAAAGHAAWMRSRDPRAAERGVVVAFDVRRFHDRAGWLPPGVDSPLRGLSSRDLAHAAAAVYAAAGLVVWIQAPEDGRFFATPELSFAIRHLGAVGGLMVSASHNPPDDNGLKVYDARGAQIVPPDDDALAAAVAQADAPAADWEAAVASGRLRWFEAQVREAWLAAACAAVRALPGPVRVVFTGLHGCGAETAGAALVRAGVEVFPVADQCVPDGTFPTLSSGIANPEDPTVLERALALADALDADLVLATDPDGDRIGAAVPGARALTGNEIAALVVDHALRHHEGPPPVVVCTEVTTSLVSRVATARGARVVDHLLVGFKYIAAVLADLEDAGRHGDLVASLDAFAAGVEESHGVLVSAAVRDKDAAQGALALASAAAEARAAGHTLLDVLADLQQRLGPVGNALRTVRLAGLRGRAPLSRALAALHAAPPADLAGRAVLGAEDRRDPTGPLGPLRGASDARAREVVVLWVDGGRVVVRASGTEPKAKVYAEVEGTDAEAAALAEAVVARLG